MNELIATIGIVAIYAASDRKETTGKKVARFILIVVGLILFRMGT